MNNLPKVVTQRCLEQDLNSRPVDRKPKRLTRCTTAPPTNLVNVSIRLYTCYNAVYHMGMQYLHNDIFTDTIGYDRLKFS